MNDALGQNGLDHEAPRTGSGAMVDTAVQDLLFELRRLSLERDFLVVPPATLDLSEAMLHPTAFEYLVRDDPRSIAFEQRVHRPLDGRGTEHPTRRAIHWQWLFLLRRRMGEGQGLAEEVLRRAGIEPQDHAVRFADRTWGSRVLEARGSGWQLEVDGLGVARLDAIERFAGRTPRHPTLILGFGVERLALAASGVRGIGHLPWDREGTRYGELEGEHATELQRWSDGLAGSELLNRQWTEGLSAARRALEVHLPRVAYSKAVSSLVPLDQLALGGFLPARERDERLDEIRALVLRVAEELLGGVAMESTAIEPSAATPKVAEEPEESTAAPETDSGEVIEQISTAGTGPDRGAVAGVGPAGGLERAVGEEGAEKVMTQAESPKPPTKGRGKGRSRKGKGRSRPGRSKGDADG